MKKYEKLKTKYPKYISLDQLYQICSISKRSARYLLEHEIIPSIDTGRKTWRYKIAIDDVITYLRRRERQGSMIPIGATSSRPKNPEKPRVSFRTVITPGIEDEVYHYFEHICLEFEDVLTVSEIVKIIGLDQKTVLLLLKDGAIKSLTTTPRYIVPKIYLLEFVVTPRYLHTYSNSEAFKKVVEDFVIWRNPV